jgi:Rieske Fe-S protein
MDQLEKGTAVKFDAPTSPNSAFIMADGGGDNGAGELAFGGFVSKDEQGKVQVFAQNCSHLGCSVALNPKEKTLDCPCHGSIFKLDGSVLHGPAAYPLSHLTWKQGDTPDTIQVDGLILGF